MEDDVLNTVHNIIMNGYPLFSVQKKTRQVEKKNTNKTD